MSTLSVIISVRDGARALGRCLASLEPQRSEIDELIVVDDGSRDDSAVVADAAGCTVVRLPITRGIPGARNAGAVRARGEALAFIDSDAQAMPGWAAALRDAFAHGAAIVAGAIRLPAPESLAQWYQATVASEEHDPQARNGFLPFAAGANIAIRREVFRALGGFDEQLPGAEALDFSFRAQLCGHTISFLPTAVVVHHPRATVPALLRQQLRNGRNRRVADLKYHAFPFQRMRKPKPALVCAASTARVLLNGLGHDPRRLALPPVDGAIALARRLGMLQADIELLAGLRSRPEPIECGDGERRRTAAALPAGPLFLLIGDDRLLAALLRATLDAAAEVSIPPSGLERQALARWSEPAPWALRLARSAARGGWSVPERMTALRIERERPASWKEALLVLHGVRAWLLGRPAFAIAAPGPGGFELARRLQGVPLVLAGKRAPAQGRVLAAVTREELARRRLGMLTELMQTVRQLRQARASDAQTSRA
jgi:GT2 family glycosyltransferase